MVGKSSIHSSLCERFVLRLGICYESTDGIPRKGLELSKAVTEPMKQFARRFAIRGFQDDFSGRKEDVLLLSGPLHHHRKPVGLC